MVLQRQVPARPAGKTGEAHSGADAAGDSRNDAFSAALSQEKRSAAAEPDKVEPKDEADSGADATESDSQVAADSGQSDEILNLLSGLMSSAAYSDNAVLRKTGPAEDPALEAEAEVEAEAKLRAEGFEEETADAPTAVIPNKPDMAVSVDTNETQLKEAAKTVGAKGTLVDTNQGSAQSAKPDAVAEPVASAKAGEGQVGQMSADTKSSATLAAAAGMAGQGAQPAAKTQAADAAPSRQKDNSAVKEVMRAIGMDGEPKPVDAETAKTQVRGRNSAKQGGVADRRMDELTDSKGGKVEVIESRRFMPAQNMSANAQQLTRSLVDAGGTALAAHRAASAQPVAPTAMQQAGQTLHTLKLQLNPASLGSVTAVLKLSGDDLSVEIKVQTAEAYRQIKEDNQSILKALRGQGFGVEQITVQHVVGPDRSSSQTPQQGFQANQQGPGSSDAQSSGKDSGSNNAGQQRSGSQGGQSHEQSSYAGPGAGRTDGVYL